MNMIVGRDMSPCGNMRTLFRSLTKLTMDRKSYVSFRDCNKFSGGGCKVSHDTNQVHVLLGHI